MKKSLVALTLIFTLLFSFAACRKVDKGGEGETEIQSEAFAVGEDGEKHTVQADVDEEGNTQYFYIDEAGQEVTVNSEKIVVETKAVKVIEATKADGSPTPEAQSILDAFKDPNSMIDLIDTTEVAPTLAMGEDIITETLQNVRKKPVDKNGNPIPENPNKLGNKNNNSSSGNNTNDPTNSNDSNNGGNNGSASSTPVDYKQILSGTKFTASFNIKTTIGGESMTLPVLIARNGNMYFLETTMPVNDKGSTKCNFLLRDGNCYMILPTLRSYYSTPTDEAEDLGVDQIVDAVEKGNYVSSGNVPLGGKIYDVDTFEAEGQTVKYYYYNGTLKRIETIMGEDTTIMEFNYVSKNVDSSKFNIPVGYMDMSKLMGEEAAN